jgi:imidazolonepropionase-like amidohydrolase
VAIRIEAGTLIPGRGAPISDGLVVLDGPTIAYAGSAVEGPPAAPDDDLARVPVVLPGLWDAHIHFGGGTSFNELDAAEVRPIRDGARLVPDLRRLLDGGVTSVRELGGFGADLALAIGEGSIPGPTIYAAGALLSTTGGHGDLHRLPLDFVQSFAMRGQPFSEMCDGVPECLRAVRLQLRRGARVIKICASGGVLSHLDDPEHREFSDEELRAIVEEAARAERIVAAHCHGKSAILAALQAGVRTIEHGSYLDDEAAAAMVDADATFVPTRHVVERLMANLEVLSEAQARKGRSISARHRQAIESALTRGVRIATGTDLGLSGPVYGPEYATASREIAHLAAAGMNPLAALEAATANGPATLGPQAPKSGELRAGYDADVIAIDFDPLKEASNWGDPNRVTHVWQAGQAVKVA